MTMPWFIFRWSGRPIPAWLSACPLVYIASGLPAALIALMTMTPVQAQTSSATYSVTFTGNWTIESTPDGVVSSAHFTTLIGAVHNDMVTFWESGGTATAGVEAVAELGATSTFRSEVTAAGANASVVSKSIGFSPTATATFDIEVTSDRPLFTLLSMIGPSPDWFVGVSSLSLLNDQSEWRSDFEVDLFPYDAGTENGNGFSLSNSATDPQGTITSIKGMGKFSDEPMAMLSFDLQEPEETNVAPTFTGSVSFSVQENSVTVGTVQATDSDDADSVTGYTIETGADGALFSITSGGALTFNTAPNYEDAQDAGTNNGYEVKVEATSGTGDREMSAEQTIMVTVTDDDTEAPDTPDTPSVSGASASSLTVRWDEPGNDGPPITDYDYQYRISMPLENWTEVTNTQITGRSTTISGLPENTTYDVQILAKNAEGSSDWSFSGTGTTQISTPGQVMGVSVTEQVGRLVVSWSEVSGANGYKVQWKSGGQDYNTTDRQHEITSGSTTSYTITDLTAGTEYTVQVIATKNNVADGPASAEITGTPLASSPGQVTGVSVTEQVEQLSVFWNAMSGANGYKVQWKSGAQNYNATARQHKITSGSTTRYTITGLTAGVEYTVRVIATRNNAADGPASAEITGTPLAQPPPSTSANAPENLQALAGNAQVTLNWDAPGNDGGADITGYQYRQKESEGDFSAYMDIPESGPGEANARSYTVTELTNGLEYVFRVRAVNEHGGGFPAEVTVTLPSRVHTESEELPTEVTLSGNYPNPFNPETTIRYALPQANNVRLAVYDLLGHEVAVLVDEPKPAGRHATRFDAGDLPSGAYVYRLQVQGKVMTNMMMLVK